MDFIIYFCKDGILRVKLSEKKPLIPLQFIQENLKSDNDFDFLSHWINKEVLFEDGLTISSFLNCIKPWEKYWAQVTGKDVPAYIKESKKPYLKPDTQKEIDWICLSYHTEIDPKIKTVKLDGAPMSFNDIFSNDNKKSKLTGEWNIHSKYLLTGYKNNEIEHYSVDHTPLNKIANTPLFLDSNQKICVLNYSGFSLINENYRFFDANHFGVQHVSAPGKGDYSYIKGIKYHSLLDVINGFFFLFANTPQARDELINQLKNEIQELKHEHQEEAGESKKVVISSSAFDDLFSHWDELNSFWDSTLDKAKKENVLLRIGKMNTGEIPENRVYQFIAEEINHETDYKTK